MEADLGVNHNIFYSHKEGELPGPGGMQDKVPLVTPGCGGFRHQAETGIAELGFSARRVGGPCREGFDMLLISLGATLGYAVGGVDESKTPGWEA